MPKKMFWLSAVMLSLAVMAVVSTTFAQTDPVFVQLGQAKGAVYKPDSGPQLQIGILVMHREANYMSNIACREFSRRGFVVLCMNSRFENNEALVDWELIPLDVAQGLNHLKSSESERGYSLWQQWRWSYDELLSGGCGKRAFRMPGDQ